MGCRICRKLTQMSKKDHFGVFVVNKILFIKNIFVRCSQFNVFIINAQVG